MPLGLGPYLFSPGWLSSVINSRIQIWKEMAVRKMSPSIRKIPVIRPAEIASRIAIAITKASTIARK